MKVMLDEGAFMPTRAHKYDAGLDLYSPIPFRVPAKGSLTIDSGVHVAIPAGYVGLLQSKSGLNVNNGILSDGVIDAGYTGSIRVKLYNHSYDDFQGRRGDKISQLVILPCSLNIVELVDELEQTERGNNGFGSTGR